MHIIITTPKAASATAEAEAMYCIKNGGGYYFRHFSRTFPKKLQIGDKVFYVDKDYITGYAVVHALTNGDRPFECEVTGRVFRGNGIIMKADSWRWIKKIRYFGFQGFRYFNGTHIDCVTGKFLVEEIGGWLSPYSNVVAETV